MKKILLCSVLYGLLFLDITCAIEQERTATDVSSTKMTLCGFLQQMDGKLDRMQSTVMTPEPLSTTADEAAKKSDVAVAPTVSNEDGCTTSLSTNEPLAMSNLSEFQLTNKIINPINIAEIARKTTEQSSYSADEFKGLKQRLQSFKDSDVDKLRHEKSDKLEPKLVCDAIDDIENILQKPISNPEYVICFVRGSLHTFGLTIKSGEKVELLRALHNAAKNKYGLHQSRAVSEETGLYKDYGNVLECILGGIKDTTQEYFKSKGITTIKLYRMVSPVEGEVIMPGDKRQYQLNPISSFTTMKDRITKGENCYLLEKDMPVNRILCCADTGFGDSEQEEYIILGPKDIIDEFEISKLPE